MQRTDGAVGTLHEKRRGEPGGRVGSRQRSNDDHVRLAASDGRQGAAMHPEGASPPASVRKLN